MYEQLGRYRLTARIATGGMAEVFLARAEGVQGFTRTVVIKRLLPHLAREPAVVEMFLNEARITGQLDHGNIVQVLDLGQANGHYYIAMEFLDGRAVAEVRDAARAQGGMLPTGFVLKVFGDALAGLHHAHEARGEDGRQLEIVHRDFNPDNIVITYDGRVKVVDFGIAKVQSAASSTEPGTLKGKYFYMSPEMVLGNPVDRRADIFAAGVALYELLCDKRPFEGDTPNAILSGIAYGSAVPPRQLNPTLLPELENLIQRCLARSPNERPPTALAVKEEIDHLIPRVGAFGQAELARMMELLFPPGQDSERQRIAELRRIDPSEPSTARPDLAPPPEPKPVKPAKPPKPPRKPLTPEQKKRFRLIGAGVGGLMILGIGGALAWPHLHKPPDAATLKLEKLEQQFRAHPGEPASGDAYADALLVKGDDAEAEAVLTKVLAAHADDARAHALMGDVWAKRRHSAKALDEYGKALQLKPDDVTTWIHQSELYVARGELGPAREALTQALARKPHDRALALQLADLQGRGGDWDKVVATLSPLVQRYPNDADMRAQLGLALSQTGDDRRAQAELAAADRLKPNQPKTETYLGFLFYKQGKLQKAIESYREAIQHAGPGTAAAAQAHAALGQIYLAQGNKDGAKEQFASAVKGDPTLSDAAAALKNLP